MNSYYSKSKKIFITSLIFIILISCFSQVFGAVNTRNLKVGYRLRFEGTRWFVYNSRTAALTSNSKGVVDYLERNDKITVKAILRKYYSNW